MPPVSTDYAGKICTNLTVTFGLNATVSSAVELSGTKLLGIGLPSNFTGTSLGFQSAPALNGTFQTVHDGATGAKTKVCAASRNVCIDPTELAHAPCLKLTAASQTSGPVTVTLFVEAL